MSTASTSVEELPVSIGQVVAGKYRVDRVLGVGGMGIVVAAVHVQLDKSVALKFMLSAIAQNPEAVARFLREARATVKLSSEHVARVFDVGTLESGAPYMVMEFLEGSDLADVVEKGGPQPIDLAVRHVLQAIDAVAEAHSLGIVHRDLKPQNLFLSQRRGRKPIIKVLDFGISKTMDTGQGKLDLTRTTTVMGSPLYMAPEQMRSTRAVDTRADVWALGVILHELLTGRVPFMAQTLPELCLMVAQDPLPSPRALRPDLPEALSLALARCLEKDPARRFPDVNELAAALEPFAGAVGSDPRLAVPAPSQPELLVPDFATAATAATWGTTGGAPPAKGGLKVLFLAVAAAGALLALVVITVFLVLGKRQAVAAAPPPSISAAVSAVPEPPESASPPPVAVVTPSAAVAPSAHASVRPASSAIVSAAHTSTPPQAGSRPKVDKPVVPGSRTTW